MEKIKVSYLSRELHVSQILTGFSLLAQSRGWDISFEDHSQDKAVPHRNVFVLVEYRGKKLVYDLLDGYNEPESICYHLEHCDLYFKRSFSEEKNSQLNSEHIHKMYPLGFNYHVSCRNHPLDRREWKQRVRKRLGLHSEQWNTTYYSAKRFEGQPVFAPKNLGVLFCTRLWDGCPDINQMRIDIIRQLNTMPGIQFTGGLTNSPLSRELAPDLILPGEITFRPNYLRQMRSSDICIGSMGLHESIGWKTGEYVAGAKAIVNERLHYSVPGDFAEGKNYLSFETVEQCLAAVQSLVDDPEKLYQMKCANYDYYHRWLRPDVLVQNTLDIADGRT